MIHISNSIYFKRTIAEKLVELFKNPSNSSYSSTDFRGRAGRLSGLTRRFSSGAKYVRIFVVFIVKKSSLQLISWSNSALIVSVAIVLSPN